MVYCIYMRGIFTNVLAHLYHVLQRERWYIGRNVVIPSVVRDENTILRVFVTIEFAGTRASVLSSMKLQNCSYRGPW